MSDAATSPENPPHPAEPIVLNPGLVDNKPNSSKKSSRGALSTFSILLAGWFFGNLLLLGIISVAAIIGASSTGLVKVPFFSEKFFGEYQNTTLSPDPVVLESAQEKVQVISNLGENKTLKSMELAEDEINALFVNQTTTSNDFPIYQPQISLEDGQFRFTGKLKNTNAPVEFIGNITTSGLVATIELTSAKFGRVSIPTFLAGNLLESYLTEIGLSLSGSQIPAKNIRIEKGFVTLQDVSNSQTN